MQWPAPDDAEPDAYVWIDHRAMETEIIEAISDRLDAAHALGYREDDDRLLVTYKGGEHLLPLTFTPHDRYVAVSSLAALLADDYLFFVGKGSLDGDTHALHIARRIDIAATDLPPDHLVPLALGIDYFSGTADEPGIRIPYLGHEEPSFERDAADVADQRRLAGGATELMLGMLFGGKADPAKIDELARSLAANPSLKQAAGDKTAEELAAELKQVFEEAMSDPEAKAGARDIQAAMAELQAVVRGEPPKPKPWWKFW